MSDYGLKIVNNNSEIQIDSTYRNFSKYATGTKATTAVNNDVSFTSTAYPPIVAITPPVNYPVQVNFMTKSGSNYTGFRIVRDMDASGTINVPYALFTNQNGTLPSATYGMIVKNSSGEVCFSSEMRYMKIKSINNVSPMNPVSAYTDITVVSADNYFIFYPFAWVVQIVAFIPPNYWWVDWTWGIQKINSTTIRIKGLKHSTHIGGSPDTASTLPDHFTFIEVAY